MRNPAELYTSTGARGRQVDVLVHTLAGSMDAGQAGHLVAEHLLGTLPRESVVSFDVDQLIDYRSRRPVMQYDSGTWTDYDTPELSIDLLRDDEGVPLLLLHGVEPDLHWESFVAAVRTVIDDFGVSTTIGAHGIPMGVPHTRPVTVTAHATRPELISAHPNFVGSVQVPGYPAALLELRLGQEGRDALGFAANVPHYLAQTPFPQAAAELIRQVARSTGLSLPVGDLEADGVRVLAEIDRQVADSDEVAAVVRALESQFDGYAASAERAGRLPTAPGEELPSADELGAQIEAFLAGTDPDAANDDDHPGGR
ncbi:MAG: proteasome assembly chaperone family protein [Beutenbergiaceae bacterium]